MSETGRDIERLDRAIERLLSNQPIPVFEEAELEGALQLANRLHIELPDDLPDPSFRESLLQQVLDPRPRLVPEASATAWWRRNPVSAFGGAIAAVFVAAVAVGVVATGQFGGDSASDISQLGGDRPAGTSIAAFATMTATVGSVAVVSTRDPQQATRTIQEANVPPLAASQIETGAMEQVASAAPPDTSAVTYELMSALPTQESLAQVYRFAVPEVDAMSMFNRVTDALDLDGEMTTRSVSGKTVISFASTTGTTFKWMPASGAFACDFAGEARVEGGVDEMTTQALQWLRNSGFPIDDPMPEPIVSEDDDGMMTVSVPVEGFSDLAVGHPLSVKVKIDGDGVIQSVSGYWLQLIETLQVGVLTPAEAWNELVQGNGFWTSTTPIEYAGHFRADSFSVAYVLTLGEDYELVLQPVYAAAGTYHDQAGNVLEGVKVLIQATNPGQP